MGAIATQANTNIEYGIKGLELLKLGFSPQKSLEVMLREDSERETRQVIIIDRNGQTAAFTGKRTILWKGHYIGRNFVIAGNILVGERVLNAMRERFEESRGEFAHRILATLEAGDEAGGDKRGRLSAALVVMGGSAEKRLPFLNLRVDYSQNPVKELRQILESYRKHAKS